MSGAYVIQSPCSNNDKPYIGVRMCSTESAGPSVNCQWYAILVGTD